eukprot:g15258.t1
MHCPEPKSKLQLSTGPKNWTPTQHPGHRPTAEPKHTNAPPVALSQVLPCCKLPTTASVCKLATYHSEEKMKESRPFPFPQMTTQVHVSRAAPLLLLPRLHIAAQTPQEHTSATSSPFKRYEWFCLVFVRSAD